MSTSAQVLPLTSNPNQSLTVPLNIDGGTTVLDLFLHYNVVAGYWVMTISDTSGDLILDSVPLITGNVPAGNILGQFAYLDIGSLYLLNVLNNILQQAPNDQDLGSDFVVVWDNTPTQ
jgi:hypothetical protein